MLWESLLSDGRWTFGPYVLDAAGFQLLEGSRAVKIERLPLELLSMLVEAQGRLVSRDDIAARLWKNADGVDAESGIHTAVRKLRAALGDSPTQPVFIETVPGKGYRFIAAAVTSVTIAVLPFENLSSEAAQEHLGDGLTEEIIGSLGRVALSSIRVIARTSSMTYKHTQKNAREIGRELGAAYLMEGTVRRQGGRVRITAKLICAQDQVQVWADAYERTAEDLLTVQQELGAAVAREVGAQLAPRTLEARTRPIQDPDAHDLYLRGRYYWHRRSMDSMTKAEECFREAIRKAPRFALAHAGLADTYVIQILTNSADAIDRWKKARHVTEAALELDPNLAEAHTASAMIDFFVGWDWAAAERSFLRAIELNPNYAVAHQFYGHLLSCAQRHDEAIAEIQKARAIDPLAPIMHTFAAMLLAWAGRHDEGSAAVAHALAIDPEFFPARAALGHLHVLMGQPDAALEEYRKAYRHSGGNVFQLAFQGWVLGRTKRRTEALQIVATLEEISRSRFVPHCAFAVALSGIDDRDAAFRHLEKAYELRDIFLVTLPCAPWWRPLRRSARLRALLRRCGFPRRDPG